MEPTDTAARLKRIEHLTEEHRAAKHRQLLRRAIKVWRKAGAATQADAITLVSPSSCRNAVIQG